MTDIAISVSNVSKCYQVFDNQRSKFLHAIWPAHTKGMQEVWALKDINFEIKRGEAVAIIGRNGGGKSTLLQILTGTLTPNTGKVKVNGRVSALLELGSGFNPEYSGRDNVILNGLLLGLSREDIISRFDEIEAFAEIGVAIDRPVKTYSSGMMMRLAFAVQVLCDPDILIIDEALSVGDFFFQQKCLSYIRGLCDKGVTLLFVSHDMGTVRDLCPRVIYLKQGELKFNGESSEGILLFFNEKSENSGNTHQKYTVKTTQAFTIDSKMTGDSLTAVMQHSIWAAERNDAAGKLIAVSVCGEGNLPRMSFKIGDIMIVRVLFKPEPQFVNHVSVVIKDKYGAVITATGSLQLKVIESEDKSAIRLFELDMGLMIEAGEYSLHVNIGYEAGRNRGIVLDETGALGPFSVSWDYENDIAPFLGKVGLPVSAMYKELVPE
jgi:lipopolysaccharide transport system ATP-binding protein